MEPLKTIAVILLTSFAGLVNGALAEVIKTPVGSLEFKQGYPTKDTIRKLYDLRDRQRATQAYLDFMSAMSMWSVFENMIRDYKQTKPGDVGVFVYQGKGKAAAIGLTYNTESIYATAWIDTKLDGPTVIEVPPNVLGIVNDGFMRYVTDLGNAGPDRGKGGKYLILPPGYKGPVPKGYFVFRSKTYRNWVMARGFVSNTGEGKKALDYYSTRFRMYPLKSGPRKNAKYVSISGIDARSIHPQDGRYFELLNKMVQHEPSSAFSAYELGLLHALGIVKGKPFKSDARMRRLLDEGARIGDAIAKVNGFASRLPKVRPYKDRSWEIIFYGGNHEFKEGAALILDARTLFHYEAIVVTPAMARKMVGIGSQYLANYRDSTGAYLSGDKQYKVTLPRNIPAKNFWSITMYEPNTRSLTRNGRIKPSINSYDKPAKNRNGSITLYFGPTAPKGKQRNWIKTVRGQGFMLYLRLYGPLQPFFDKSWKPNNMERAKW